MALADRDYHKRPSNISGGGFLSQLSPMVKWLLFINIGIFVLDYFILPLVYGTKTDIWGLPRITSTCAFRLNTAIDGHNYWQFFSFQFMHGGLLHIAFNSIGLYFFGPWMERWWGSKKFIAFYLLCGAAGAGFYTFLHGLGILADQPGAPPGTTPLVGASAGIYGILIGVAMIAPNLRVQLLFPPIELTMRQLAIGILGFATIKVLFSLSNAGGEAGHLGGAIMGYLLMHVPKLLGWGPHVSIHPPSASKNPSEAKLRPRTRLQLGDDSEVDAILDKISNEGFQSLTDEEKEILKKAAEKQSE